MKNILIVFCSILLSGKINAQCQKSISINTPSNWTSSSDFGIGHNANQLPPASWMGGMTEQISTNFNRTFYVGLSGNYTFNFDASVDNELNVYIDSVSPANLLFTIPETLDTDAFWRTHTYSGNRFLNTGQHSLIAVVRNEKDYGGFILRGSIVGRCLSYEVTDSNTQSPNTTNGLGSMMVENLCCQNEFSVVTPSEVPPNFSDGSGFTYSVEDYNVNIPNTIPITEIRVNVEGFELISKYDDCLKCYNPPTTLGSMVGLWNIGSGPNTLYNQNLFPNDWFNTLTGNPNEAIWSNPRGVMLNRNDLFKLIYIFPESSNIPCCVDSAKICLRIAYTDVNCGRCEVTTCSIVPLTNLEKESAEQAGNGKGRVKATMSLKDLLLSSNSN